MTPEDSKDTSKTRNPQEVTHIKHAGGSREQDTLRITRTRRDTDELLPELQIPTVELIEPAESVKKPMTFNVLRKAVWRQMIVRGLWHP